MSYSRFSFADVYVYMDVNGTLACCGCSLSDQWYYRSTQAMVDHLAEHRTAGHDVPDIEAELWADDADNFPPQCADGHDWGEQYQPYPDLFPKLRRVDCRRCGWTDSVPSERLPKPAPAGGDAATTSRGGHLEDPAGATKHEGTQHV